MELIASSFSRESKGGITNGLEGSTTISETQNVNAYYLKDTTGKYGLLQATGTADGSGSEAEFAMPIEFCSDYYIYGSTDLSSYRLVCFQDTFVKVLDASGNVLYTHDGSTATKHTPLYFDEGNATGATNISTAGPFRFVGTAPFYLVCQEGGDQDEATMLGAMQHELSNNQRFKGGYLPNATTIDANLVVNDTNFTLFADSANNRVGIGTQSPSEKLTVAGAITSTGALTDDRTSTAAMDFSSGVTRFVSYGASGTAGIFAFRTAAGGASSSEKVRIDGSGNVGIGVGTPSTKLHIQGSAVSGSSSDANTLLTLTNNANNSIQINSSPTASGQIRFGHNTSNFRGALTYYHSSNILGITTSGTERVRIDTTGAKFSENFGSTDDVLHIAPSNGGNRTMTIDGQKIDVTFTNGGGSTGLELQGNGGATTFGGAVSGITTLSTSSSITTGYGVAFTNGNTNFLQYNNAGENVLYLRDTTNGQMLLTYGTTRTTIHKNTRHSDQVEFEDTNAVINRVSNDLEIRTYAGYDINLMAAGNVGVGTQSPSSKFHVSGGDSRHSGGKLIYEAGGVSDYFRIQRSSSSGRSQIQLANESGTELWRFGTTGGGSEDFAFWDGDTNHLVFDRSANSAEFGGSVGINVTPSGTSGRLDCSNDVVAFATSDKRLKENIKPLDGALDKILKISGVEFDWKPLTEKEKKTIHGNEGHDVGVIAQEIEEVLPEVVTTRDSGYKAVKYEKIVPLLIEAIKEQQKQIEELKNG